MATVKILKKGYLVRVSPTRQHAGGTITLIKGKHNIIVDTGLPQDKRSIISELKKEKLTPADITYVVCTHGHSEHIGNINLFPRATFVVAYDLFSGDLYTCHDFDTQPYIIDDDVKVISTPGHSYQDISVLVKTAQGIIAVVGDLFETRADLQDREKWGDSIKSLKGKAESREAILQIADFIIPGHGDMFPAKTAYGEDSRTEEHPRRLQEIAKDIVNEPLDAIPLAKLAVMVEHALKYLGDLVELEKNPIDQIFPSLYANYRSRRHSKHFNVQELIEKELNEFQKAVDFVKDAKKLSQFSKVLHLKYFEEHTPEEIWKILNLYKNRYYKILPLAVHTFTAFLRKREKDFQK